MTPQQQEALWIGALAVVPVAVLVAMLCRASGRPATRHALWMLALGTFVVPGVLVMTGWSAVVANAVLGVPRALAWAFPPERAGVDAAGTPLELVSDQGSSPFTPTGMPNRADRAGTQTRESVLQPAAADAITIEDIEHALRDARARRERSVELTAPEGAAIPGGIPQATHRLPRLLNPAEPRVASNPWAEDESGKIDDTPLSSAVARDATARSAERFGVDDEQDRPTQGDRAVARDQATTHDAPNAANPPVPEWAAWLLAEGFGVRVPETSSDDSRVARRDTAESDPTASQGSPLASDRRATGTDLVSDPNFATAPGFQQTSGVPRAPARGSDAPAIIDPIWNAMTSASIALEAWAASIGRAAASVADIPAPPAALWVAGVLVIIALGGMRTLAGNAAIRRVQPVDRTDRRLVEDLSERLGLRQAPRAYLVKRRISPMVCGGLNPKIILPEALWKTLDLDARRAVLTHELAHLRRRDQWIRLFELLVGIAYWWHPVLWAVRRQIREEADLCCDAWVTTLFPGLRRSYAEALVRTRVYLSMPGAVAPVAGLGMASARSRKFSRRLTMVMTGQTRPRTSPLGVALALAVGAATLVVVPSIAHATLGKRGENCPPEQAGVAVAAPTPRASAAPRASSNPFAGAVATTSPDAPPMADAFYGTAVASTASQPAGSCCSAAATPSSDPIAASVSTAYGAAFAPVGTPAPTDYYAAAQNYRGWQATPAPSDGGLEERMRALEARIEALDTRVQRLLMHLEAGADAGAVDQFYPVVTPATTPVPSAFQSLLSMPQFQVASEFQDGDDGEASWQAYSLPEGKLEALYALMSRSDVPIYVSQGDGEISLEGTPAQQRVFAQFLALIHPEGAEEWLAGTFENDAWRAHALAAEEAFGNAQQWRGDAAAERDARAMLEHELVAERARGEAVAGQRPARQDALRAHRAALEAELVARAEQGRHMAENRRATARQHAEMMARNAEQMERRAEQVEGRLEQLRERADSARTDAQREALEVQIEGLEAEADALREAADEIREQSDDVSAELEEAMADMEADLADARDELEEAMAELEEELAEASENDGERAVNCACTGDCTGEGCEDDCDENCHCRTGTAAPAQPADVAPPARAARPARPATPATPRPMRD